MNKRAFKSLTIISFVLPMTVMAAIYQSTDQSGNVIFSDMPGAGSKVITSPEPQTFKAPALSSNQVPQQEEPLFKYAKFAILSPENNGTVRDNSGNVMINLAIDPPLRETDKVQLIMDGNNLYVPIQASVINLTNVDRGTHTVQVQIIDDKNQVIATTNAVTFHLHQARITNQGIRSQNNTAPQIRS
jgi:hypothetical protein